MNDSDQLPAVTDKNQEFETDFKYSRETYYDLVERGRDGIEEMLEVAKSSQHPRAYEVLGKLIKDTADVADKLMDLNKKEADINRINNVPTNNGPNNTTNNVYVGTTADLQRMMAGQQQLEKDITPDS